MAVQGGEDVYATLLLSDNYLPGALVLAHSLRDARTTKKLAVLVTLDSVSAEVITQLKAVYDYVIPVPRIKNERPANLYLMNRPDLHSAFTKINLWKQTQFRKIVYIDADVVAYRAPDELFDIQDAFSAAPDIGWPDLFNTGVMVLTPNMGDYYALTAMAERGISFDGADQGLLNMHFKNSYNRLPFTYNVTPSAHYQYIPAYRHFQSSINMVHFIGADKPWLQGRHTSTGSSPFDELVGRWWAVYDRHYRKDTPTPEPAAAAPPQPPELVQYFVKGEYEPRVTYVLPTGEPHLDPATSSHGQHYHHHHDHQQHRHEDETQYHPPSHDQHHHHHHHHHHQHGGDQHHHDISYHPPPPPSQPHYHPEQSHPPASLPPSEQSFSAPSVSFSTIEGAQAEARKEQVPDLQQWAPPPPPGQEHKPEPPQRPPMEQSWDAQRQPPPPDAKPEALNFPQTHYEMSSDAAPFVPPERYPSPPRDMWYQVPKEPPAPARQRPPAIFPWETHRPRVSRVFVGEELQTEPLAAESSVSESLGQSRASLESRPPAESSMTGSSTADQKSEPVTPTTPTINVVPSDPWSSFTRTNAWDDVPEIERYVGTLQQKQRRVKGGRGTAPGGLQLGGVGLDPAIQAELEAGFRRRGSKVTDFPSEVERPSLPVTPAPIRRPKFWDGGGPGFGDDGDDDDQFLPAAEGVPPQTDWDPVAQLQKLAKQQSELLLRKLGSPGGGGASGEEGAGSEWGGEVPREIPTRPLPFGSEDIKSPTYVARSSAVLSPQPLKPGTSTSSVRNILGGGGEHDSVPRTTGPGTATSSSTIPEPSYHGPGLMFEKDEGEPTHGMTAALPSEEERDVLDT